MFKQLIKSILVAGVGLGTWQVCRFLEVPVLYLSFLGGWGATCFLFSYELAGSRYRKRNGIEEKTPMQIAWMVAGIICILTTFTVLFFWF